MFVSVLFIYMHQHMLTTPHLFSHYQTSARQWLWRSQMFSRTQYISYAAGTLWRSTGNTSRTCTTCTKNLRMNSHQCSIGSSCQLSLSLAGKDSWISKTSTMMPQWWACGTSVRNGYQPTSKKFSAPKWHPHNKVRAWTMCSRRTP